MTQLPILALEYLLNPIGFVHMAIDDVLLSSIVYRLCVMHLVEDRHMIRRI